MNNPFVFDRDFLMLKATFTDANPPTNRDLARLLNLEAWQPETPCDCHDGPHYEDDGKTPSRRYVACGVCVSAIFRPACTEIDAGEVRALQLEQLHRELPELDERTRQRGALSPQQESDRLMPPTLPRLDRKRFAYRSRKGTGQMIDHAPVRRRNHDLVGLTVPQNCLIVPNKPGRQAAERFTIRQCSAFVGTGHAVWYMDRDAFGNVYWQRYLRSGMFWGEAGRAQCEAIADELGVHDPFNQTDVNRILGTDAPLLKAMAGHVIADRWRIISVCEPGMFMLLDLYLNVE